MEKSTVAPVYGEALFSLALESGQLGERKKEVEWLQKAIKNNVNFTEFLAHPEISKKEKEKTAEGIFKEYLSKDTMGLFILIIQKGRGEELEGILEYFMEKESQYQHVGSGTITSAIPLRAEQKQQLEDKLIDLTEYKTLDIEYLVDKSLLGGFIVRVGNKVLDNSIKGKLSQVTGDLLNKGREIL